MSSDDSSHFSLNVTNDSTTDTMLCRMGRVGSLNTPNVCPQPPKPIIAHVTMPTRKRVKPQNNNSKFKHLFTYYVCCYAVYVE